jgi:hypothetical protein
MMQVISIGGITLSQRLLVIAGLSVAASVLVFISGTSYCFSGALERYAVLST